MKWLVLEDDECVHVVPETDILPHGYPKKNSRKVELADINCPCKPEVDFGGTKVLINHNSFEEREKIDESMDKL